MNDKNSLYAERDLLILEHIEDNPNTTQADLAAQLGVAVGSVNWYIKRLVNKGYVKVKQLQRRRLRYLITPQGITEKARLTYEYMQASLQVYSQVREQAKVLLSKVKQDGYDKVYLRGPNEVVEICALTCLELGLEKSKSADTVPILKVDGRDLLLEFPGDGQQFVVS